MQTTRHSMLRAVAAAASAALLVTALTVPVAAAPKGEDIQTEFPPQPDVICDGGETLEVIVVGWLQPKEWGLRYKIKLVYFDSGDDVIRYLNEGQNRRKLKIGGFEYFGHSNKYCWTFDYSNEVLGASSAYLHQRDLRSLKRGIFARNAFCKSWGCHSGESFVQAFKQATGTRMQGAVGKTDYSQIYRQVLPFISTPGGRWSS